MKCKKYPSAKIPNRYIYALSEVPVNDLPKEVQDEIGQNKACEEIELSTERHQQIIKNIKSKGYDIGEIRIKEIEGQNPPKR